MVFFQILDMFYLNFYINLKRHPEYLTIIHVHRPGMKFHNEGKGSCSRNDLSAIACPLFTGKIFENTGVQISLAIRTAV